MDKYGLIGESSKFDAVILAAGDFPKGRTARNILMSTTPLIVCDSALEEVVDYNRGLNADESLKPSAVVGDGDSLPTAMKEQYGSIWHQFSEQDYNDLTKATRFTVEHYHPETIAYVGATGKREDHTLGNISLMAFYLREFAIRPTLITDYGWFTPAKGIATFESFAGQQVSIFNISCNRLEGVGFGWNPYPYAELWQGTLNEATGNEFTIISDGEFMIYQTFERKIRAK